MAYDIFTGLPLDQTIQGATWDNGGLVWATPTYLVGTGSNSVKVGSSMPGAQVISANFLPSDTTTTCAVFFTPGADRPSTAYSVGITIHSDGSVGSAYTLNGVRANASGYGFLQCVDVATGTKVEISAPTTNGQQYCLEVICINRAAGTYCAKLYNASNGVRGTLVNTTATLTLGTPRPATAKMSQMWRASDVNATIQRVETIEPASADTTGPVLESPTGTATGATSATGTIGTNEAGGLLYYLVSTSGTGVSAATIKSTGQSQSVGATGTQNVSVSGLTSGTTYYLWYYQEDAALNPSNVATSAPFTTSAPDTTAPTFPGGAAITPGTITSSTLSGSFTAATDNVAIGGYQRSADGGTTWEDNGTGTSFTFTGMPANTTFPVRIRAYDTANPKNYSAALAISMTTAAAPTGSFTTDTMLSSGTIRANQTCSYTWFAGGAIGSATGTPVHGTGTLSSSGTLVVSGLSAGSGYLLVAFADGGRYYQEGTVN